MWATTRQRVKACTPQAKKQTDKTGQTGQTDKEANLGLDRLVDAHVAKPLARLAVLVDVVDRDEDAEQGQHSHDRYAARHQRRKPDVREHAPVQRPDLLPPTL